MKIKDLIEQDFKEEISDITKINIDVLDFDSLLSFHELLNKDDEKIFSFIVNIGKKIWGRIFDKDDESDKRLTGKQAYVRWLADYALCLSPDKQKKIVAVYDALCLYGRYICLLDMGNGCLRGGKEPGMRLSGISGICYSQIFSENVIK